MLCRPQNTVIPDRKSELCNAGLHFPKARWGARASGIQHEPRGTSIRWLKHRARAVPSQHLHPVCLQQRLQIEPMLVAWGLHSASLTRLPLTPHCKYGNHHPALWLTPAAPPKWYTANHETPSCVFSCTSRGPAATLSPKLFQNRTWKTKNGLRLLIHIVPSMWLKTDVPAPSRPLKADALNLLAALLNWSFPAAAAGKVFNFYICE